MTAFRPVFAFGLLGLAACDSLELPGQAQSGRAAMSELGCGACHAIPGIAWPKGRVGPPLADFGSRALIAGKLPNTAENLAAFVRDATRHVPDGAMPPIAMTEAQARDIAMHLLSLNDGARP